MALCLDPAIIIIFHQESTRMILLQVICNLPGDRKLLHRVRHVPLFVSLLQNFSKQLVTRMTGGTPSFREEDVSVARALDNIEPVATLPGSRFSRLLNLDPQLMLREFSSSGACHGHPVNGDSKWD
jgi:hypothetical protein